MIYLHSCKNVVSIKDKKINQWLFFLLKVLRLIEYQSWPNMFWIYVRIDGIFERKITFFFVLEDELFRLVVGKGGLVEVINKKLWREVTKGLNLPSSITSAAFTLRTQYVEIYFLFQVLTSRACWTNPIRLTSSTFLSFSLSFAAVLHHWSDVSVLNINDEKSICFSSVVAERYLIVFFS